MSMFKNLTNEGLEKQTDRLGGGSVLDTDIYSGTIKLAYAIASQGGAKGVSFEFDLAGHPYRETIYITNKKGENYFMGGDKKDRKVPLPGFTTVDNICLLATEEPLSEQEVENKVVKVYDFDEKKEVNKAMPVLTGLLGKPISLAIQKSIVNKNQKNESTGEYEPTAEEREENTIEKVFHTETRMTATEAIEGADDAVFWDKWLEKNKGQVRDKRKYDEKKHGSSGRPTPSKAAPQATAAAPKKSLFAKKA